MRMNLPKSREGLVIALDGMVADARIERNINQVGWYIANLYLKGVRNFSLLDYDTGSVDYYYEDDLDDSYNPDNGIPFRWEVALSRIQTEVGRLAQLDTRPKVTKRPHSLNSLRNASISQALLDTVMSGASPEILEEAFYAMLVMYGTVGLTHFPVRDPELPYGFDWDLIPPWELLFLPRESANPSDRRMIGRERLVPLAQLEEIEGYKLPKGEDMGLLDVEEMAFGSGPSMMWNQMEAQAGTGGSYTSLFDDALAHFQRKQMDVEKRGHAERFVNLQEFWVPGPRGTLAQHIVKAGRAILFNSEDKYRTERVPFPIGIARYIHTGSSYGRSFAGKVIPFAARMERLMDSAVTNVQDMDRFGYLMVPHNLGVTREDFEAAGNPRIIFYEPLYDDSKPVFPVQPVSASDVPGRMADFMSTQLDLLTSQSPLLMGSAPGRAESGVAFQTLAETGSTHLMMTAKSIKTCFATVYRSLLWETRQALARSQGPQTLDLVRIENRMAGIRIDRESGQVQLGPQDLPDPWTLNITIESEEPTRRERERQEAYIAYQDGLLVPLDFYILNYKNGWGYPVGQESVWENYVKAVLLNLIFFNDGETPGNIDGMVNFIIDKPEVHLLAMEDFMAGSWFTLASPEVQTAFIQRYQDMQGQAGRMPNGQMPLDQAAMQAQMQQMSTQAQMQGAQRGLQGQAAQ